MIKNVDELEQEEEEEGDDTDVLGYSGTFEGVEGSGLHVAIRYQQQEVAWLLLALGSQLEWSKFPNVVFQGMQGLGLQKEDRKTQSEIRNIKDSSSRTPADLAKELGGVWVEWLTEGRLNP